jgi:hypothetical protein
LVVFETAAAFIPTHVGELTIRLVRELALAVDRGALAT